MNVLFIEDEKDLRASGMAQMENKGHKVYPANDIKESRALLSDANIQIDLIISDHRLPDGLGIQFALAMREEFPACQYVIVSGCLNANDIFMLKKYKIPYFMKPLLYSKVFDAVRKRPSVSAPIRVKSEPEPESEPEVLKKKRFSLLPKRKSDN